MKKKFVFETGKTVHDIDHRIQSSAFVYYFENSYTKIYMRIFDWDGAIKYCIIWGAYMKCVLWERITIGLSDRLD